jgi:UDP-2,3-diacylglucosamine pyrophosphatase LpxH
MNKFKFDLISDLHEDINNFYLGQPNEGVENLVIAGDLAEYASLKNNAYETLRDAAFMYKRVFYVPGNHEYYGGNYQKVNEELRAQCEKLGVFFLQNDVVDIEGTDIAVVGGTAFADSNEGNPRTMHMLKQTMADFTYITYGEGNPLVLQNPSPYDVGHLADVRETRRTITPEIYYKLHKEAMSYFANEIQKRANKKIILVTHHALSEKSVMPRFFDEYHLNGGYRSCEEKFFEQHRNIAVHCHGHMHDFIRYELHSTRVYCNPYGYQRYEPKPGYRPITIEV